ncbi:MAG: hypothetical protein COB20_08045 [SAR86 cluster bacterium]|uniref:DUF4760 domain-containing protein n=1 Tax=SAR86 cluster bacterium TaxID=2030880 RepID=A0A2A4X4F1_9GAMM|nr:MAG: hypothetical protein COB20_08045 [SAR86 cluster bacterium]
MDIEKFTHWLTLVANFGVIAGVVFLAYELQQNNELLVQESRYSMLQNQKDWTQFINGSEEVSNLLYVKGNQDLSDIEKDRRFGILLGNIFTWQWEWEQSKTEMLGGTELPVEAFRALWRNFDLERDWPELRLTLRSDFVTFMENEVSN